MATICLDLDGTVLDISDRYWLLHSEIAGALALPPLTRDRFWAMKRARVALVELMRPQDDVWKQYQRAWLELIETPPYLSQDRVIEGVAEALEQLASHHRLVLATMRRDRALLETQLSALGLADYFAEVLVAGKGERRAADKPSLISSVVPAPRFVVGDTEEDITAGRSVGAVTVAVLTGLRDEAHLRRSHPDVVIAGVASLPELIRGLGHAHPSAAARIAAGHSQ